jgi:hypothetical protein
MKTPRIKITFKVVQAWLGVTYENIYEIVDMHLGHYGRYCTVINDSGKQVDIPPYAYEIVID